MKVGDYVRTKSYGIAKVKSIYNNTITNYYSIEIDKIDSFGRLGINISNNYIIKSSPNIIDLIEVGDIVNYGLIGGGMVLHKENDKITTNTLLFAILKNEDIKSIVTKEQFESMEYKVGE